MVSGLHNGEHGRWVENDKLWADALGAMVESISPLGERQATLLPGTMIALGRRNLSFLAEIPAGYRVIESHNVGQRHIRKEDREARGHTHRVFVPKMIIGAQFSAGYRLNGAHLYFSTIDDRYEFSSPEYINQKLYHTAFSNVYSDGRLCLPAVPLVAPFPTLASMMNTAIELIFGSTFNNDMGMAVPRGVGAYNESHPLHIYDQDPRHEKWAKMTPEQVLKLKWKPHHDTTNLSQVAQWYNVKLTMSTPEHAVPTVTTRNVTTAAHGVVMNISGRN